MRDLHRVSGLLMKLVLSMYRQCHFRSCGLKILTPVNGSLLCSGQRERPLLGMFRYLNEGYQYYHQHLHCLHLVIIL